MEWLTSSYRNSDQAILGVASSGTPDTTENKCLNFRTDANVWKMERQKIGWGMCKHEDKVFQERRSRQRMLWNLQLLAHSKRRKIKTRIELTSGWILKKWKSQEPTVLQIVPIRKSYLGCQTKKGVEELHAEIKNQGYNAALIHGDKS